MSGDEQSAMKREINAQLNKLRAEQRERLERRARRRAAAGGLLIALLVALLAALGFALWRQPRLRDAEQSYAWTPGWWAETHTLAQGGSTPPRATTNGIL
jgi:ferric-dicitrate binding protein FerR (iron transport regulator)